MKGLKSLAAPWVFCSLTPPGSCRAAAAAGPRDVPAGQVRHRPQRAKQVVGRAAGASTPDMAAYTAEEFSSGRRVYWLTPTKAGIAIGYAALLGLLVGAVITAQTLYAATAASAKEFAILLALGIPRWRISLHGADPVVLGRASSASAWRTRCAWAAALAAARSDADVDLRWEVLAGHRGRDAWAWPWSPALFALRSVRQIEPMTSVDGSAIGRGTVDAAFTNAPRTA